MMVRVKVKMLEMILLSLMGGGLCNGQNKG
jgi:hypothetical protein